MSDPMDMCNEFAERPNKKISEMDSWADIAPPPSSLPPATEKESLFPNITAYDEMKALNCPCVGDVWSEVRANQIFVCGISDAGVQVLFLWGGGRRSYLFDSIDDFQEWLMYDGGPVNGMHDWCWANFVRNDNTFADTVPTWATQWLQQAKETGIEHPNDGLVKV